MTAPRQYELVYIVSPEATDEQIQEIQQLVQDVVTRGEGTVERLDNWGRRRLAYPIKHKREGIYVVTVINGLGDMVKEIERRLRVHDVVLRHLVVRVDEDLRKAARAQARREAAAARRRPARASAPGPGQEPGEESPPEPAPEPALRSAPATTATPDQGPAQAESATESEG